MSPLLRKIFQELNSINKHFDHNLLTGLTNETQSVSQSVIGEASRASIRHHTHGPTPPRFSANLEESHRAVSGTTATLVSSPNQQASHFTSPGRAKKRRPTNVIAASRIRTARRQRPAFHLCSKQATLSYLQLKCRIRKLFNITLNVERLKTTRGNMRSFRWGKASVACGKALTCN